MLNLRAASLRSAASTESQHSNFSKSFCELRCRHDNSPSQLTDSLAHLKSKFETLPFHRGARSSVKNALYCLVVAVVSAAVGAAEP